MKNWQDTLVQPTASLEKAIEVLDTSAQRILLVVDQQNKLLGTVTDGDVRRALLRHIDLSTPVAQIMNTQPKIAGPEWSNAELLSFMEKHQHLQIPIVNSNAKVLGMVGLYELIHRKKYDNPIFLMAGGFGKRLHPLTETCPKPLLKIGGKPILELILESFVKSGFYKFYISTHYMPEKIKEYFGDGSQWNVSITYIHEKKPLGTAGALGLLPNEEIDLPIFMMNGDLLTSLDYVSLLKFHQQHNCYATMCVREYDYQIPYGVIKTQGSKAYSIEEKPIYTYHVNSGIYILSPELIRKVPYNQYLDMPDLLQKEIRKGNEINVYELTDYWMDIGHIDDFIQAQSDYKLQMLESEKVKK
ncbi:nucleotidyltransferase family protein [Marinospirillum sp.]|uniref:nucleotidyltransferase family protein n=1 Tax=Marinospirillum sp. TaxID=2183934 RepID=UPI00384F3A16